MSANWHPMIAYVEIGLFLLAAIASLGVAANRLHLPPSILLVIAGAGLAMIPGLPRVELAPELVDVLRQHQAARLTQLERAEAENCWLHLTDELALELIEAQREHIHNALRDGNISDESRRRVERDLDLLEAQIRHDIAVETGGA